MTHMKKISILGSIGLIVLGVTGGTWYYFFGMSTASTSVRPPKDLAGIIVPPVTYAMKGKTFFVPHATNTKVVLDLVSPTAKYDYPMGRYTGSDGVSIFTLSAQDDLATSVSDNLQAVPIVIAEGDTRRYYLAILAGEDLAHVASLPIGDMIKIQNVSRTDNQVTILYLVHDRAQAPTEVPSVSTTAIFDIKNKQIVQAGRTPATESYVATKSFAGEYIWKTTKFSDGKTVTPNKPDVFTLLFDANRISLGTDCNTGGSIYTAKTGSTTSFIIEPIVSTKMFCEPGQEGEYFSMMQSVQDYTEGPDGTIIFILKDDAKMTFVPKIKTLEFASSTPRS